MKYFIKYIKSDKTEDKHLQRMKNNFIAAFLLLFF